MISDENKTEKKKLKKDDADHKAAKKEISPPPCSKPKPNPMALTNFFNKLPPGQPAPTIKLNFIAKKQNEDEMKKSK